jgi:hypothetical protein
VEEYIAKTTRGQGVSATVRGLSSPGEAAEKVGETVFSSEKRAIYVLPKAVGSEGKDGNTMDDTVLPLKTSSGGGGNRTRADPKP